MATYMIRAGLTGAVKIGKADDVPRRLASLQTGNPETLYLLRVIDTPFDAEPILHDRFANRRIRGEWFEYDEAMLTFIPQPAATPEGDSLASGILRFGVKRMAALLGARRNTVMNWAKGIGGPQGRYAFAMLRNTETAPVILAAAGLHELINPEETIRNLARQVLEKHGPGHPVLQRPDVKAALVSEGK